MRWWIALLATLSLATAQTARWTGAAEYRTFNGTNTGIANLDRSYAAIYPAQGGFKGTVIFVPGFLGGSGNFEALARRLLLMAPGWEVWAWDRRANGLEDRAGFSQPDPWAYYQNYKIPEVSFLKDWGLKVHLDDLEVLVRQARTRGPVVLAGHSLGASMAGLYALYRPDTINGLIFMDGALRPSSTSQQQYLEGGSNAFGRTAGLNELLAGRALPYISLFGLDPVAFAQAEAQAFMAAQNPQADAPTGWAAFRSSRIAAALYRIDERYQPFATFAVSVGQANGREGLNIAGFLLGSLTYTIRGPRGARVEWIDNNEPTDPLEFLQLYANPSTGFSEWFFPYRLTLDVGNWKWAMPELQPRTLSFPILSLGAGRGLLPNPDNFRGVTEVFPNTPNDVRILPGLTHVDILTSRNGLAVAPIAEYLSRVR